MSTACEEDKNKNKLRKNNIAELFNSGNSCNHINVCSHSKSNVKSMVKAEAEQEQEQEQEIDF